jgi:cytochrome c oxidase subunit 2
VNVLVSVVTALDTPSILGGKGNESHRIAGVWWLMFGLATAVYVIVAGFILVALLRGRRTEHGKPTRLKDDTLIWIGGLAVPTVILAILAVVTVTTTENLRTQERGALVIDVVGKRWWWDVSYPGAQVVTANEIHVPVGRPIDLTLRSDNVVHSFWVPQLAGKLDMVPGQTNHLRIRAREAGTYRGECAEFCGIQHALMQFVVIADEPVEFDRWLARQAAQSSSPTSEQTARGQLVFLRESCAGCHTIRGTGARGKVGPDLSNFGSRSTIGAATVPNTRGYLSGWIADAQAVKPGNLMPPIPLEPADLDALVAYLESLK